MKINDFFSKFDKKRLSVVLKLTIFVFCVISIINIVGVSYSKYESSANMSADANIAFFLINQGTYENSIALDGLTPQEEPYIYTINVSNHNNVNRTSVDLTYTLSIKSTTNLPLSIQLYRNEPYSLSGTNVISSSEIITEGDMYFKNYTVDDSYEFGYLSDEMDQYTLVIFFPEMYKYYPDDYSGKIDLVNIIINAQQVV